VEIGPVISVQEEIQTSAEIALDLRRRGNIDLGRGRNTDLTKR
jgi:hypothetical protein